MSPLTPWSLREFLWSQTTQQTLSFEEISSVKQGFCFCAHTHHAEVPQSAVTASCQCKQ